MTDNGVTAEDAGTITCTVTINGSDHTSEPFTLRISGEHLWLVRILCAIVYYNTSKLKLFIYVCIAKPANAPIQLRMYIMPTLITKFSSFYLHTVARSQKGNKV